MDDSLIFFCSNKFYRTAIIQDEDAKGEASKYYAHASRENGATIDAFIKYLGKKEYSHLIELSKMSEYLHKIYG